VKRSKYLVHWTGKDIQSDIFSLTDDQRQDYLVRLFSILEDGFWMTKPQEMIYGRGGSVITYKAHMTCFTEIRLSAAEDHAKRYGLLGIGVLREFVLDLLGGPVHYVRNRPNEAIIGNIYSLFELIKKNKAKNVISQGNVPQKILEFVVSFFKPMTTANGEEDFSYLNEQEWRIVHSYLLENKKIIPTGKQKPKYRITLKPEDVKLIVFPDEKTRNLGYKHCRFSKWVKYLEAPPIMVTLEECGYF
jgi:hypothetical protein